MLFTSKQRSWSHNYMDFMMSSKCYLVPIRDLCVLYKQKVGGLSVLDYGED